MKNPLEILSDLEEIIRDLHKINSKLLAGQVILAHREVGSLMAFFEQKKKELIRESKGDINEKQH